MGWCSFRYGKLPSVNTPSLSVILPTYNEADNIGRLIDAVEANVPGGWDYQILVCDEQGRTRTLPLQLVDGSHRYSVLSATEPQEYVVVLIPGPDGLLSDYLIELLDLPGRRDGS